MRRATFLLALVLAASAAAGSSSASGSPSSLLAAVVAAAHKTHSVHYISTTVQGTARLVIVGDAGTGIGEQKVTYSRAGRVGHATVIATAHAAYLRSDAFTLSGYLGVPAGDAAKLANRWLLYPAGSAAYAPVAQDVRVSSLFTVLKLSGTLETLPDQKLAGSRVLGIRATKAKARVTLYASRADGSRPVEIVSAGANGEHATTVFSAWNEPVKVRIPTGFGSTAGPGLLA